MSNRIQQVLRDARAMVEDPRPSTPASVGLNIRGLGGGSGSAFGPSSGSSLATGGLLNGRRRPTALRGAHPLPAIPSAVVTGNSSGGNPAVLIPHSPPPNRSSREPVVTAGTPPSEPLQAGPTRLFEDEDVDDLVFLERSAKEAAAGGSTITATTRVGSRWKQLLTPDDSKIEVCLRAAASIFRFACTSKDALLDAALAAVFETLLPIEEDMAPQATCRELRAAGALDALIVACRSEEVLQSRSRLAVAADIVEVLSEDPANHDLLVTNGIFLFVADALKETLRGFLFNHDGMSTTQQKEVALQDSILDLLLFTLRNVTDSGRYTHHVPKTGILTMLAPLLKNGVFTTIRVVSKLSYDEECVEVMVKRPHANDASTPSVLEALVRSLGDDSRVQMDYLSLSRAVLTVARLISSSSATQIRSFPIIDNNLDELLASVETLLIARGKSPNSDDASNSDIGDSNDDFPAGNLSCDIRVDMIVAALLLLSALTSSCVTASSESGSYVQRVFVETGFVWCTVRNVLHEDWGIPTINELALVCLSNYSYYLPIILSNASSFAAEMFTPTKQASSGMAPLNSEALASPADAAEAELVEDLTLAVCPFLFESDTEATLEALRTLSNVALLKSGRAWMVENSVDEACTLFLGHEDPRVVFNSVGVLINMTSTDSEFLAGVGREEALAVLLRHTGRLAASPDESGDEIKELVLKLLRNLEPKVTDSAASGGCIYDQDAPTPVRRKPASGSTSPANTAEATEPVEGDVYETL